MGGGGPEVAAPCKREKLRQSRRRRAWREVTSGTASRVALDEATGAALLAAVDSKASAAFGIERLSRLELDGAVGPVPKWVASARRGRMGLVRYSALRGRAGVVEQLLRGGARFVADDWGFDDDAAAALTSALADLAASRKGRFTAPASVLVALARMVEAVVWSSKRCAGLKEAAADCAT